MLAGAVETDASAAHRFEGEHPVKPHARLADLIESGDCEAVLVMTPPATHEDIAARCLEAGLHVLCEKPLSIGIASAERMAAAARRAGRILMMASKFRYVDELARARELVDAGAIGRLLLFENAFCSHCDMTKRWNSVPQISGGGVLIDNGCHSVDVARFLCGPLARIQAQFGINVQLMEVEDTARILFEAASGTMGSIDLSWSLHKEVSSYVRLYGSEGTIEVGWRVSRMKRRGDDDWTVIGGGYDKVRAFQNQLTDFARAVRGAGAPRITLEDALFSVRAIDAAYESARRDKWVPIG